VNGYDGPTLRSLRESAGVALRKVARIAGMSHGHLSKVERGEPGRPVTPAVLAAYEKVTGMRLTGVAGHGQGEGGGGDWRRGHLSEARRRTLNAKIAAVAVGGPLGEQTGRILDSTGRILAPARICDADVSAVEQAAAMCTELDLRLGGAVCDQQARALLRWAVGMLASEASERVGARLHAAIAALAQRAGWSAFDADSHDVARSLLTIALFAAARADDPDLRAHVLADLAAQHNYLGYPEDCLRVVRFGEVDERVGPRVRSVLNGVKARAYAVLGDARACWHHIELAEDAHASVDRAAAADGWLDSVGTAAHLFAMTGHAAAALARRVGTDRTRTDAGERLNRAIELLHPQRQARPVALCLAQLATLHLEAKDLHNGVPIARRALTAAAGIRSVRLVEHLMTMRAAAAGHEGDGAIGELLVDVDAAMAPAA
jgi:transcriptional regulator with XRE-family HTH domain